MFSTFIAEAAALCCCCNVVGKYKINRKKINRNYSEKILWKNMWSPKKPSQQFSFPFFFRIYFSFCTAICSFYGHFFYYSHDKLSKNISKVFLEEVISGVFIYLLLLCLKVNPGKHTVKMKGASLLLLQHSWFIAVCD